MIIDFSLVKLSEQKLIPPQIYKAEVKSWAFTKHDMQFRIAIHDDDFEFMDAARHGRELQLEFDTCGTRLRELQQFLTHLGIDESDLTGSVDLDALLKSKRLSSFWVRVKMNSDGNFVGETSALGDVPYERHFGRGQ